MKPLSRRLAHTAAAVLASAWLAASAAPVHFSVSFGGPDASALASTSLASILRGDGEGLFTASNLQYASFSGIGVLGFGNVTSVGAIQSGVDANCVDKCRRLGGELFQGGQHSGSYILDWYFNDVLAPAGEFPPGSGVAPLKDVGAHPVSPGNIDYPAFLAAYTPYPDYASLYGARLRIVDLLGNDVFNDLFRSSDCTEAIQCSAFEVKNDFEGSFSNPVDGFFMHFEGPTSFLPEPTSVTLVALALLGVRAVRRRRQRAA